MADDNSLTWADLPVALKELLQGSWRVVGALKATQRLRFMGA